MSVLPFETRLNAVSWAAAVSTLSAPLAPGDRVVIDLSEVDFADFVTLGHLLIFVRSAAAAGIACSIRLPDTATLAGEDPDDPATALRTVRRHKCRLYLQQTRFLDALTPFVEEAPEQQDRPPSGTPAERVRPSGPERSHGNRRILPYRWVPRVEVENILLVTVPTEIEQILRELGVRPETAAAVTRGIVLELLDNAHRHSGAEEILLGGVFVDAVKFWPSSGDFDPALGTFVDNLAASNGSLIRLVVADAGGGFAAGDDPADLAGLLDRRSAGGTEAAARGLWKVSRLVRAYRGALLISSGRLSTGRRYDGDSDAQVAGAAYPMAGGTLIECAVPAEIRDTALIGAGELRTARRSAGGSVAGLACLAVPLYSPSGLGSRDQDRLRAALSESGVGSAGTVVAVTVPRNGDGVHDVELFRAVSQVSAIAAESAGGPVALAFPNVNRPLMSLAMEFLNAEHDDRVARGEAVPPPLLVIGPYKWHYWAGGEPARRRALGAWSSGNGEVADVLNAAMILPQDAVTAMVRWIGREIEEAIGRLPEDGAAADVWHGKFLTPSLRLASRWYDLDSVLTRLDLHAVTGMALAAAVEDLLPDLGGVRPLIVRSSNAPRNTVTALARALTGRDDYADGFHDLTVDARPGEPSAPVVLVIDTVSRPREMLRALADIVDRDLRPVAVAVVVDSRPESDRSPAPDIDPRIAAVPLVSLAGVDVTVDPADERPAVPIDHVLRRPETGARPMADQLIEQEVYVESLKRNAAARLGHIERPAGRHYTAYVDPTLLLRDAKWSTSVLGELAARIRSRHDQLRRDDATVRVLYPEGAADDLTMAVSRLCTALAGVKLPLREPVAVPRAAPVANWQLPGSVSLPGTVDHVVILDSGASTGRTVQQLIGLAADEGASLITVVLLLNGLSDGDALNLQRIVTVRGTAGNESGLETIYVAKTSMSDLRSGHCSVCALRAQYASVTFYAPVPDTLARHRRWLLSVLRARTKNALFSALPADLFGAKVSQSECVDFLAWRLRLRDASTDTARRLQVTERVMGARTDRSLGDALVRLLVAESHWLDSVSPWFPEFPSILVEIALARLVGRPALLIEQRLRVQAVILLAQVAPERFAERFADVLRTNRHETLVVDQVLLEALVLLSAARGPVPGEQRRIIRRLGLKLADLEDALRDRERSVGVASEFVTLPLVRYLLSHAKRPLRGPPEDAQEAWFRLRHEVSSAGHDFANPLWMVQTGVELAARRQLRTNPDKIGERWVACANFLLQTVLPNATPLRDILLSKQVLAELSASDEARWEETLSADGPRAVFETTARIENLVEKLKLGGDLAAEQAAQALADLGWWWRFVLNPKDALLSRAIASGPVEVVEVVRDFFNEPSDDFQDLRNVPDSQGELLVFCTERLINDVLEHIRFNAVVTHVRPGAEPRFLVTVESFEREKVAVTVRNTESVRGSTGTGKGLETLEHRLARFGGTIVEAEVEQPWTYGVTVLVDRWRM
jgi:hypothetical protein